MQTGTLRQFSMSVTKLRVGYVPEVCDIASSAHSRIDREPQRSTFPPPYYGLGRRIPESSYIAALVHLLSSV